MLNESVYMIMGVCACMGSVCACMCSVCVHVCVEWERDREEFKLVNAHEIRSFCWCLIPFISKSSKRQYAA